ncbi:acyl-CoA dehydrogenase family protein [Rhodococcus opacus]|uniref:acyl-CoA dehydrogenase family protein n=1 Tax=Rhodococcus opacus TaxID=37919 RepID=UPI000FFB4F01|nr:acyl-CoA dehydrogenase family protein [Rhodococcus opacus]
MSTARGSNSVFAGQPTAAVRDASESLEEFAERAQAFLMSAAKPLGVSRTPSTSDGSPCVSEEDRVSLFRGSTVEDARAACDWRRQVFDAGFGWIKGPKEWGGAGLSGKFEKAYLQFERQYETPSPSPLGVSLGMVGPTLNQFGSDEAKQRWLTGLYRGDFIGCQLFSEPAAGSDLASVKTKAIANDDHWIVTGQKVWTSGAHYSDVGLVLARTSPSPRHGNLTVFLVDMHAPGVEVKPLRQMTGEADFNEVFLDNVKVEDAYRLGEIDEGWQVAMATLLHERGAIGGSGSGGTGLFDMNKLAAMLISLGVDGDPMIRQQYATVATGVAAAKAMRSRAEAAMKSGQTPGAEMSLSKLALTRNLAALSDLVSKALGPKLLMDTHEPRTYAWTEYVLGVPGFRLGGGTDEIQRNIIAERVLDLPKEPTPRRNLPH